MKRVTWRRSKRSRAGRSSFGKRQWRVRKRGLWVWLRGVGGDVGCGG